MMHSHWSEPPRVSWRSRFRFAPQHSPLAIETFLRCSVAKSFSRPGVLIWGGVLVVGCVAGIGFTMALFIGALAFLDVSMLAAKIAVLPASGIAGVGRLVVGYRVLPLGQSAELGGTTPDGA